MPSAGPATGGGIWFRGWGFPPAGTIRYSGAIAGGGPVRPEAPARPGPPEGPAADSRPADRLPAASEAASAGASAEAAPVVAGAVPQAASEAASAGAVPAVAADVPPAASEEASGEAVPAVAADAGNMPREKSACSEQAVWHRPVFAGQYLQNRTASVWPRPYGGCFFVRSDKGLWEKNGKAQAFSNVNSRFDADFPNRLFAAGESMGL